VGGDLIAAGLSQDGLATVKGDQATVEQKWRLLRDVWPLARQTAYGRVVQLSLEQFFGETDFADGGAERATDRLREQNVPGLYRRVFHDTCRIGAILTQRIGPLEDGEDELFTLVIRPSGMGWVDRTVVEAEQQRTGGRITTLDDFHQSLRGLIVDQAAKGTVGIKVVDWDFELSEPATFDAAIAGYGVDAYPPLSRPTMPVAEAAFKRIMNARASGIVTQDHRVVCAATMHFIAELAEELDLVVAVHSGAAWDAWLDFRPYQPLHLVPLLQAHPGTRFDVYHAGLPWCRDMAKIAKIYPNAWVNLTWAHIVSPEMTVSFLDELLDMVPPNKVLGFGGDYGYSVENVYGHLVIARENIARVLARRVDKGLLAFDQAVAVAHGWLWENPIELYRLKVDVPPS